MIVVANSNILGQNIKYLRKSKNLSLEEMADLIQIEEDKLKNLESGISFEIEYTSLCRIYDYFEGDMDHLFDKIFD